MADRDNILLHLSKFLSYPNPPKTPQEHAALAATWLEVLDDVPNELLDTASLEYRKSGKEWRPAPGVLRERCIELSGQGAQDRAALAWQMFLDSNYGRDKEYMTDEIMLRCVRELGGFNEIGNTDSDKIHFVRDRFIEKYMAYAKRDDAFLALPAGQREHVRLALAAK